MATQAYDMEGDSRCDSSAHLSLNDFERRFRKHEEPMVCEQKPLPSKCLKPGGRRSVAVKNPRTLQDLFSWTERDPYEFIGA